MEDIIKKAIEGGYPEHTIYHLTRLDNFVQVLDPLFFQAIGKACGWYDHRMKGSRGECLECGAPQCPIEWIENGKKFHEINLTQGWNEAIAWLDDLIKK